MTSSFFDSVHELKTKFPVNEETPVFMYKFIFLAFSLDKEIFGLLLNMFINRLDYQPLFGKMSPHSFPEDQRPDPGDGGNRA